LLLCLDQLDRFWVTLLLERPHQRCMNRRVFWIEQVKQPHAIPAKTDLRCE
jgi:hypothetical protein